MGVLGLWDLVKSCGCVISPDDLSGAVFAIDASVWLVQAAAGMRDANGRPVAYPHLRSLFYRVCKLLHFGIRPVFVFDGPAPALKKETLRRRRQRKLNASSVSTALREKQVLNVLKRHAVGETVSISNASAASKEMKQDEMFRLPPLPSMPDPGSHMRQRSSDEDSDAGSDFGGDLRASGLTACDCDASESGDELDQIREEYLTAINPDDAEFRQLPLEAQHEVLSDLKEVRTREALHRPNVLPDDSFDFSRYQMKKMREKNELTRRITQLENKMKERHSEVWTANCVIPSLSAGPSASDNHSEHGQVMQAWTSGSDKSLMMLLKSSATSTRKGSLPNSDDDNDHKQSTDDAIRVLEVPASRADQSEAKSGGAKMIRRFPDQIIDISEDDQLRASEP